MPFKTPFFLLIKLILIYAIYSKIFKLELKFMKETNMETKKELYFFENNWNLIENNKKAKKIFKFKTFSQAFAWMTEVAFYAEKLDHHPDWTNVYNTISVLLSTHDKNKLTEKDILLAKFMDQSFDKYT